MNEIIITHDDIIEDCLESQVKEFGGLSSREYILVLRTVDYICERATLIDRQVNIDKYVKE